MAASVANFAISPAPAQQVVVMGPSGQVDALSRYTPFFSNAAATQTVLSAPGVLHSVVVMGGAVGSIGLWDSASAATGSVVFACPSPNVTGTYLLDVNLANGLVLNTFAATNVLLTFKSP